MDTKKINKMMNAIKSVAKKSTKVVGASLPIVSIGATALDSWEKRPSFGPAARLFVSKFTGVSDLTGKFDGDLFMSGTGQLLLSGVAGWAISQLS